MPSVKSASPKVTLTVRSTSGRFDEDYNKNNRVEKVLDDAKRRWNLSTGGGAVYVVKRERGDVTMNPSEKLLTYELVDGDVVVIQTNQAQDG